MRLSPKIVLSREIKAKQGDVEQQKASDSRSQECPPPPPIRRIPTKSQCVESAVPVICCISSFTVCPLSLFLSESSDDMSNTKPAHSVRWATGRQLLRWRVSDATRPIGELVGGGIHIPCLYETTSKHVKAKGETSTTRPTRMLQQCCASENFEIAQPSAQRRNE